MCVCVCVGVCVCVWKGGDEQGARDGPGAHVTITAAGHGVRLAAGAGIEEDIVIYIMWTRNEDIVIYITWTRKKTLLFTLRIVYTPLRAQDVELKK